MTLTQTSHDSSTTTDKNKGCRQKIHSEANYSLLGTPRYTQRSSVCLESYIFLFP